MDEDLRSSMLRYVVAGFSRPPVRLKADTTYN
jgi:hypothetical protein